MGFTCRSACKVSAAVVKGCSDLQRSSSVRNCRSLVTHERVLFVCNHAFPSTSSTVPFSTSARLHGDRQDGNPRDLQAITPSAVQALSQPKPEKKIIDHRLIGRNDALNEIYNANNYAQQSNEDVRSDFYNRNPRNLELMNVAHKREGWQLDLPKRDYYYRLRFDVNQRQTSAWIEHWTGDKIVSASTSEWAIAKHLYRPTDVSAAFNIGRVLGHRLLQTGIYAVNADCIDGETRNDEQPSERIKSFFDGLQEFGIELQEPLPAITPHPYKEQNVQGRIKSLLGTNSIVRNPFK